jgi:hypothetical protein
MLNIRPKTILCAPRAGANATPVRLRYGVMAEWTS